jgi:prepilin signal peptidase PulO-like enzyme (type II secretory pathway)
VAHFVGSVAFMLLCAHATISGGWVSSLIGMVALAAFYFVFERIGAMGFGDVKLALGLGLLFGWPLIVEQGFLGIVLGGIPAVFIMLWLVIKRKYKFGQTFIAFGPFIGVAAYISMFWGWEITRWYLGLFLPASKMPGWLH